MTLQKLELDKLMQQYSISQFRNIPEYVKICEAFTVGLGTIQDTVDYLSDVFNLDKATGIWLDYIGALVGEVRGEYIDTDKYFCVNAEDVNVPKFFYFPNSINNGSSSLSDDLFRGQIKAKIAYNVSKGTREDLIKIIKYLVNADRVIIEKKAPMVLDISLYGENILKNNIVQRVLNILPNGVGLYGNDITIYDNISYEDIERQINEIVEMTNISEPDLDYEYDDIDNDLDDILEI